MDVSSRLSIGGSERKQRRVKKQASRRESESEGGLVSSVPRPSSFSPRSPDARRTAPLTEGLEQASVDGDILYAFTNVNGHVCTYPKYLVIL